MKNIVLFLLFWLVAMSVSAQQEEALPPNPFAGFETIRLPNGLKVWFKHLPDDPNVFISVTTPFGSDDDPVGKEELAHFTEHMLFTDHLGRTEEQIEREVSDLGGVNNAGTYGDHTFYYVRLDKQYGLFALDWLYRIVSPHEMASEIVERQRTPLMVELDARPRELMDWVYDYYLFPAWLRLPDFWEREFGLRTRSSRDEYLYRSLSDITPEDLRWFYNTYYAPECMTLTVIGNIERDAALAQINATFGTLPARPAPKRAVQLRNPQRYRQSISWEPQANVSYHNGYKFYQFTARDHQMLLFIQYLLDRRLNNILRFGEQKAVYGIWVQISQLMTATYFGIGSEIGKSQFAYARQVIEDELEALRSGTLSDAEFTTDQRAVARNLRTQNIQAETLGWWVAESFYDPALHQDFPDMVTFAEQVTKQDVTDFVRQRFLREHQLFSLTYPLPVDQVVALILPVLLAAMAVRLVQRVLLVPVDMTRIRYVARFKMPPVYRLLFLVIFGLLGAVLLRLCVYGYEWLTEEFIAPIENVAVQWGIHGIALMAAVFGIILLMACIPSKLLVFDDHLRVKYHFYRSQRILPGDIVSLTPQRFQQVLHAPQFWKCLPLTFGFMTPGLHLRLRNGRSYFFQVRKNEECQTAVSQLLARQAEKSGQLEVD